MAYPVILTILLLGVFTGKIELRPENRTVSEKNSTDVGCSANSSNKTGFRCLTLDYYDTIDENLIGSLTNMASGLLKLGVGRVKPKVNIRAPNPGLTVQIGLNPGRFRRDKSGVDEITSNTKNKSLIGSIGTAFKNYLGLNGIVSTNTWVKRNASIGKDGTYDTNVTGTSSLNLDLYKKGNGTTKLGAKSVKFTKKMLPKVKALMDVNSGKGNWLDSIIDLAEGNNASTNIRRTDIIVDITSETDGKTQVCTVTDYDFNKPLPDFNSSSSKNNWFARFIRLVNVGNFSTNVGVGEITFSLVPNIKGMNKICATSDIDFRNAFMDLRSGISKEDWFKNIIGLIEKGSYNTKIAGSEIIFYLVPEVYRTTKICAETDSDLGDALMDLSFGTSKAGWLKNFVTLAGGGSYSTNIEGYNLDIRLVPKLNGKTKLCVEIDSNFGKALMELKSGISKNNLLETIIRLIGANNYSTNIGGTKMTIELSPEKNGKTKVTIGSDKKEDITTLNADKKLQENESETKNNTKRSRSYIASIAKTLKKYLDWNGVIKKENRPERSTEFKKEDRNADVSGTNHVKLDYKNGEEKAEINANTNEEKHKSKLFGGLIGKFFNKVSNAVSSAKEHWLQEITWLVGGRSYSTKIGGSDLTVEIVPENKDNADSDFDNALLELYNRISNDGWLKTMIGLVGAGRYTTNFGETQIGIEISPQKNGKTIIRIGPGSDKKSARGTDALNADKKLQGILETPTKNNAVENW